MDTPKKKLTAALRQHATERRRDAKELRGQAKTLEQEAQAYEELIERLQSMEFSEAALEALLHEIQ